jgi:hypothetical protein
MDLPFAIVLLAVLAPFVRFILSLDPDGPEFDISPPEASGHAECTAQAKPSADALALRFGRRAGFEAVPPNSDDGLRIPAVGPARERSDSELCPSGP